MPYEQRLILSLSHPVRENRMLAIQLLGDPKSSSALAAFAGMLRESEDPFEIKEIVLALGRIGTQESWKLIDGLGDHPSRLVRDLVRLLSHENLAKAEGNLG